MNLLELKRSGFSDSQAKVVHAASKNFIKDDEDEEVLEEEILGMVLFVFLCLCLFFVFFLFFFLIFFLTLPCCVSFFPFS